MSTTQPAADTTTTEQDPAADPKPRGVKRTAKNRLLLTQEKVAGLKCQDGGREYHYDSRVPGLAVAVTTTGNRTFYWVGKTAGRTVRVLLGKWPVVTVDAARTAAMAVGSSVANGGDPQAARLAERHGQTVMGLWTFWQEHTREHKKSWERDEWLFNSYLKDWSARKLSAIHATHVQTRHTKIGREHGHYAANRMLSLLSAMYNVSDKIGFNGPNPCRNVKRFQEHSRDRYLTSEELPRFFDALNTEPDETMKDFFHVCLLTGARKSNCLSMRWDDLHLSETGWWRIPDTKSGKPVVVPLVSQLVDLLRDRRRFVQGEWVFPGRRPGTHLQEPKSAWKRILKRAGLSDLRPHDLRRTLGSWQAINGSSLPVIGRSLGHTRASSTQVYSRLSLAPVADSVGSAVNAMLAYDATSKPAAPETTPVVE